ncbi:hypothetical protein EDD21DRAFT_389239 [Dissophora ornata]|nr:hypothetical protein EDD21DRAFT_389239 [Dissophora ornata]
MDEPMVIEAVEIELKASGKDAAFLEYSDHIFQVVTNLGINTSAKGDAFEPLVRRCLQRFNGYRVIDLPFLQDVKHKISMWPENLVLQIDSVNTAAGFGYSDCESLIEADLGFLSERCPSKMFVAASHTRPDGAWFFSEDDRFAGSLGIKLYSERFGQAIQKSNETSTDLRCCFLSKDGKTTTHNTKNVRQEYEQSGTPSKLRGILRIHIQIPGVSGGDQATHVKVDHLANTEDLVVYINLSNLDSFFSEDIAENLEDIKKLKALLRHIAA